MSIGFRCFGHFGWHGRQFAEVVESQLIDALPRHRWQFKLILKLGQTQCFSAVVTLSPGQSPILTIEPLTPALDAAQTIATQINTDDLAIMFALVCNRFILGMLNHFDVR
jgi:hypothetical protein